MKQNALNILPGNLVMLGDTWKRGCWLWVYQQEGEEQVYWRFGVPAIVIECPSSESMAWPPVIVLLIEDQLCILNAPLSYNIIEKFKETEEKLLEQYHEE